jgi:hypothetical protein
MPIITNSNLGNYFPSWTTGTRPSNPGNGQTGFNSTLNSIEVYNGTSWVVGGLPAPSTSGNVLMSNGTSWNSSGFWNVTTVGSSSTLTSGTTTYTLPTGAMLVTGTCFHPMGSSKGSRLAVNIKNSGGTTLFTYNLTGGNENNGTSGAGGANLSARGDWAVAIPSAAQGGTLDFFRSIGGNSLTLTINQVITYG